MKKKASILFLLMKVVFHTIPRGLTAIPRKANGVLVSRTGELKQKKCYRRFIGHNAVCYRLFIIISVIAR
ncbi:hypothetical protein [Arsenophonus endosymbiont of Bemisia tabaci]|uniref:hypothetical protein n=1 Tax=Arsenophonus endosymbiont of Bemisia tabaci TaxID=536059 RepID=UPI0015F75C01|nr:hypothetical protein [Arsenophonus endosymbiont of Bemisia tabaci]